MNSLKGKTVSPLKQSAIPDIKTTKLVYPQIYSYILPEITKNEGSQKIGYTERKDVEKRISEQTQGSIRLVHETLWHAPAFFKGNKQDFTDRDFHKFLLKNNIERRSDLGREWFFFNGYPEKSKELFDIFRKQGFTALQDSRGKVAYELRDEQKEAIEKAKKYFEDNPKREFLWNAKPRFGKTLASYDLAKQLEAKSVLILTNRPSIANSWYDDYNKFIDSYVFISEISSLENRPTITREQYVDSCDKQPQINFVSLQDLKGSKYFGGPYNKLEWVANLEWDLLVIDEAHEGVDTIRTDKALDQIKRKNTLHLSGTPFKQLADEKFPEEAIFNWTYLDEQKVKRKEREEGESGAHINLPDLRLFTYRISEMITDQVNEGIEIENQNHDFAFDLNEFFSTKNKKFVYESDVRNFLRNLSTNTKYPFSTPRLRDELKHTFWYVGNRVEPVKALEALLKEDPIFKDYKIIVAAGDGKTFAEEKKDFDANEKSFNRVKQAIEANDKTITLSCGQLTTGVTIKEWSAVLMLTDIQRPSLYMQAAFRAQNPYVFKDKGGNLTVKESAYLFDFAPTRVLEMYDKFANGLNEKAVKGEITESERKENIKELLNFFPVISEDTEGQMVELDTEQILTFPNAILATEIVKARFMTNLLFNENIKNVFSLPSEATEIINKMSVEKNKRVEKSKTPIDFEEGKKINNTFSQKINENAELILGEKIYAANLERIIDNFSNQNNQKDFGDLSKQINSLAEPLIEKTKEVYKLSKQEAKELQRASTQKVKTALEEYESADIKDTKKLKEDLNKILEDDLVQSVVTQKEDEQVEKVRKTQEEEIRDRLRSFTRTIPMFIMANTSGEPITIDNFDTYVSDADFEDLTSITKDDFHKLRDGFDYEEGGVRKTFGGVFDKYRFNASIAEFIKAKESKSNYFETEEDIFELIPNQKTNQIFTPRAVVKMMIDSLEKEDPTLFQRTDSRFIDLYMKSGMYITEIVKKIYTNTRDQYRSREECLKHILENQVYGLAPTGILQDITQAYIFGFDVGKDIDRKNFLQHDITPEAQGGVAQEKLLELFNLERDMKFDAVVGNPPYQSSVDGYNRQEPIYQYFYDSAEKIGDKYCLISPARFLFNAGLTPELWNSKMLHNPHIKVCYYNPNSSEVFSGTEIKGGVAIIYFSSGENFGVIKNFIPDEMMSKIAMRLDSDSRSNLDRIIFGGRSDLKFNKSFVESFPESVKDRLLRIQEKHHGVKKLGPNEEYELKSSTLDVLPYVFQKDKPKDDSNYYCILGLSEGVRSQRWIEKKYMSPRYSNNNIDKWKVFISEANGNGTFGETLSEPIVGAPYQSSTPTFIGIGAYNTEEEAINTVRYIKTKFVRSLLGILKVTQHHSPAKWAYVPIQDFTSKSDIDWSQSISDIDQQLYKKYKLTKKERTFIEEKVQPME